MTYQNDKPDAARRALLRPPEHPAGPAPQAPIRAGASAPPPHRPRSVVWLVRLSCIVATLSFIGAGSAVFRRGLFLASHGPDEIPAAGYALVAIGVTLIVVLPAVLLVVAFRRRT